MIDTIVTGDCLAHLPALPAGCAQLVFADPPFNIGYSYDLHDDSLSRADYLAWVDRWLSAALHTLSPDGTFWLAIGDDYCAEYRTRLDALGLHRRSWVIWEYAFGVYNPHNFGRNHTHLLYYTRHRTEFTFNPDAVLVPSARQTKYRDKRAVAKGRVPGDVWSFPRVCGTFRERNAHNHKCQMPESVLTRIISACSNPGDLILDPFAGTGTTLAVAKKLSRHYFGTEISPAYVAGIMKRLAE